MKNRQRFILTAMISHVFASAANYELSRPFPNGLQLLDQIDQKSQHGDYRGATEDLICYDLLAAMDGQCLKDPQTNAGLKRSHDVFLNRGQQHKGLQAHFEKMSRDERLAIMKNQYARVNRALTFDELQGPEWLYELSAAKLLKQSKDDQFTCKKECEQNRRAYLDAYAEFLNKQISKDRGI